MRGETLLLRELRQSDYPMLVRLRNDLATQGWSRTLPPDFTLGMYHKRFDDRPYEFSRDWAIFVIETLDRGTPIGFCSYTDHQDRFEATIGIVVEKERWGTGASFEASDLLLRFLFHELGLRVVRLWTQSGNTRAAGSAEKLGFRVAARLENAIFKEGEYRDNLMMDLLREEWYELHPDLEDGLIDPFR